MRGWAAVPASLAALACLAASTAVGADVIRTECPNGLVLLVRPSKANDIVAVDVIMRVSPADETTETAGITSLMQTLLLKGTQTRTAEEIAIEMEAAGGVLDTDAADDYAEAYAVVMREKLDTAFELLDDVLFHPVFPEDEVEKERAIALRQIQQARDSKFNATHEMLDLAMYGREHPYGLPVMGTEETVSSITRVDIVNYHRAHVVPSRMVVVVVGDVDPAGIRRRVEGSWGRLAPGEFAGLPRDKTLPPLSDVERVEEERDIEQAFLLLGFPTCSVSDPDYATLKVLNALTGGGMSSRLFYELRDKRGLAYELGSFLPTRAGASQYVVYMGTTLGHISPAVEGILDELQRLARSPVSEEELERAKNYLLGTFAMDHQRNKRQAWYLGWYETLGVGYGFDEEYPALVREVSADDVRRVARKYFGNYVLAVLRPQS